MKKFLIILAGIGIGGLITYAAIFSWQNLRGIGPAINPPSQDITEIIENPIVENKDNTIRPAENLTQFPLQLPEGFSISIFAKGLSTPRVIAFDDLGHMLVSIPSQGKIVALPDDNKDGKADKEITVVEGLNRPHGLYLECMLFSGMDQNCFLFVAESHQVVRYRYKSSDMTAFSLSEEDRKVMDLPNGGIHHSRTIFPLDENKLLVSTGSSCNVCIENDSRRAAIWVTDKNPVSQAEPKPYSVGLRNAVFIARHPLTNDIWVTEMGRDLLGDDLPPDEINILKDGGDFGWPYCYGKNIDDTSFTGGEQAQNSCEEPAKIPSHIDLPAHSAPLGLAFIPREGWPEEYWDDLIIAFHGSWNRSQPTGYKLTRIKLDEQGNYQGMEDFISGWLDTHGKALGRPVDIVVQPGGVMYVSDDKAGVIYKIHYQAS